MKLEQFTHPVMSWEMTEEGPLEELQDRMEAEDRQETGEEYQAAMNATEMILGTDAPPGIHDFHIDGIAPEQRFHGIVVNEDGELDPNLTAHSIYIAQQKLEKDSLCHIFIEDITWQPQEKLFVVGVGS